MSTSSTRYLVHLELDAAHGTIVEQLIRTLTMFLEGAGPVARENMGCFAREGRAKGVRTELHLTALVVTGEKLVVARRIETVLRSIVDAAGIEHADVRVFRDRAAQLAVTP